MNSKCSWGWQEYFARRQATSSVFSWKATVGTGFSRFKLKETCAVPVSGAAFSLALCCILLKKASLFSWFIYRIGQVTLKMNSAQVVEPPINVISNSPFQDYTHPDCRTSLNYDICVASLALLYFFATVLHCSTSFSTSFKLLEI